MAVKATFLADFSGFEQALAGARQKIVFLESDTDKVSKSLARMTESFSGKKVIQDAGLAVKAVNDLGGVTKLTAAEQERLNATVTAALAKYKALGQEAPAELQKVSAELNTQKLSFKDLALAAGAIAGVVAGASAAIGKLGERGAGVNDVREQFGVLTTAVGETADAILNKLRPATLGTISDFKLMQTVNLAMSQGLSLTAEQFGLLGDTAAVLADRTGQDVATAFDTLTKAMATGQDRALKNIGINIDAAKAEEAYAASINKKVGQLDEAEKKHAIQNAILEEGTRILAMSGKAQEDFGDKVGQSSAKLSNFVDSISSWIATSPSIGAWTGAITAASSSITAMGLAYGPLAAGLTKLGPLVAALGTTFATLGVTITATVIPALGTAFALISPFLLPLAALAAAIGAVYLAWKNWDKITAFVKAVYDGVKTWLMDKLGAVLDWVGKKVAAVTGFFKDMYEKVVGHSYVPDMMKGIAREFGTLPDIMVRPTERATTTAGQYFREFADNAVKTVSRGLADILTGTLSWKDGFLNIWRSVQSSLSSILADILENVIGSFVNSSMSKLGGVGSALNGLSGSGSSGGIGGIGGGLVGGLVGGAVGAIGAGIGALVGHFKGGEEGQFVNPRRGTFVTQFGPAGLSEEPGQSGFYNLAGILHDQLGRGDLFDMLIKADTVDAFERAEQLIVDILSKNGLGNYRTYHEGGMVPGDGNVPAILQGGERVLNRAETQQYNEGGGDVHVHIGAGAVVVNGANRSLDDITDEIAIKLPERWRRNFGRHAARGALGIQGA